MTVGRVLMHAFGERYESPVPTWMFVVGGALVVLVSFLAVYTRQVAAAPRAPVEVERAPSGSRVAAVVSVAVLAFLIAAGLIGNQELAENILPTTFWVLVWVAVPISVGVIGDWTRPVNPFAALARAADRAAPRRAVLGRAEPLPWPDRLGYWPAVAGFFVVVAGELIFNGTATLPRVTATGLLVYALICGVGGAVFGAQAWCSRAEVFSVLLASWGRLGWFRFGAPGHRGPAGGIDLGFDPSTSRVVFTVFMLGSVTFDGLISTPQWTHLTEGLPGGAQPGTTEGYAAALVAMVAVLLAMLGAFGAFAVAVARVGGYALGPVPALAALLPSLVPIAFGYLFSHYLQYVLINGQLLIPLLGNPLGSEGVSLLPAPFNDSYEVNTGVMPLSVLWYVQIVVIVLAHVAAVVIAHRHLHLAAAEPVAARRSEWPWLAAMVGYTMVSLWLLAQPLIAEHHDEGAQALKAPIVDGQVVAAPAPALTVAGVGLR